MRIDVKVREISARGSAAEAPTWKSAYPLVWPRKRTVDSVGLFDTEWYMHVRRGGGKTSSFKRCLFLKSIQEPKVMDILVEALSSQPSPLCYFHLLHGGGAVRDVAPEATALGCRDWDLACVVTGVWQRDPDGDNVARAAVSWVCDVAGALLPLSSGAYGADLGPDPRDAALAAKAFGPNRPRLAWLELRWDPHNVLAYACPLPKLALGQRVIILVTGGSGAGKDYCADVWASALTTDQGGLTARAVSISDVTKRQYAEATGADIRRLLHDRSYKEQHRPALTAFFQDQVRKNPSLPEGHFLEMVNGAADVDVLLITGMRDKDPVATLSHLVPDSKLLEVRIKTTEKKRGGLAEGPTAAMRAASRTFGMADGSKSGLTPSDPPALVFNNDTPGDQAAERFAKQELLPLTYEDLQRLAGMVREVPGFPRPGIEFRHVLDLSQRQGGLALGTTLLRTRFRGRWADVGVLACCEAGGFVVASALAERLGLPLALIRDAGKLPPPTVSVAKPSSHVSSPGPDEASESRVEMGADAVPRGARVVVEDDVLATGRTLRAVLGLLGEAGVGAGDVSVMVVAEFPAHQGRELLRRRGFGEAEVQSLLVFDGA